MHVLMVVNNPGSNDVRVVKQAEEVVCRGMRCTVLGIIKPDYAEREVINGVVYVRVRLVYSFFAILLGFFPQSIAHFTKLRTEEPNPSRSYGGINRDAGKEKKTAHIEGDSFFRKFFYFMRGLLVKVIFKVPFFQPIAIRVRQGAYLRAFYGYIFNSSADIVHSHELAPLESCVLGSNGRRVVYDSHELEIHRNSLFNQRSRKLIEKYERKYIYDVYKVFAVSEGCAKQLMLDYGLKNVGLLMNCPLLRMQKISESSLRSKLNLSYEAPLAVYTGSITFNRGIEKILAALVYLPSYHFVCVGPSSHSMLKALNVKAESLGVNDRFHIVGKVSPEILISFISSADIAVMPIQDVCLSYHFCLPNKIFEAMHAGLAILASDLPDMASLIKRENIGHVHNMAKPESIAKAMEEIYMVRDSFYSDDKVKALSMQYSFENEMQKLMLVYK